jgi:hypothetical protein
MVTSIRVLGASVGLAPPLAAAIVLYWAGGTHPGLVGLLFTVALSGIPLGALSGAAFAPHVIRSTRPILVAAEATFVAVSLGFIVYAVILAGRAAGQSAGTGAGAGLVQVFASVILVGILVLGAWAFAMPYALVATWLLRQVGERGVPRACFASTASLLMIAALITAIDALRQLGA